MGKILFVGDVVVKNENDIVLSSEIEEIFHDHQYKCCNLEGPICLSDKPISKIGPNIKQNLSADRVLKQVGFNVFCLANNHIADYGLTGLLETKKKLQSEYILGAGQTEEDAYSPLILDVDGVSVSIINAAESGFGCIETYPYGYAWINSQHIKTSIIEQKKQSNYVICVVHAGLEDFEQPLPEWRDKYRELIDLGADMVIGHHPHVLQGYEEYHGKMIFYSLGNFIWQKGDKYRAETIMLSVDIKPNLLNYQIYAVDTANSRISLIDKSIITSKIEEYNKVLAEEDEYITSVNEQCTQMFKKFYCAMYYQALSVSSRTPMFKKLKIAVKLFINRLRPRYDVLFHNTEIETHYYSCRRAFRLSQREAIENNENQ